ncbi:hypothetical protein XA68_16440 [Ophiocordyceps unilateralis]|uniref:HhH-GPD domain-containing protein n=1 Tax=Ophiocordyceps unilateralis TaxID=268505 RepID=A0A2A9PK27_OPHUN|nr:hypothetical protein XA68_16440 [Ophiocordyceps unilateralis]
MAVSAAESPPLRRSARKAKRPVDVVAQASLTSPAPKKRIKTESPPLPWPEEKKSVPATSPSPKKRRTKTKEPSPSPDGIDKATHLRDRKLKAFAAHSRQSPFPDWAHPTPAECALAHDILAQLHGDRVRPERVVAPAATAGCGNSPSVLDALVRTILSQNTSDRNSSRAKRDMDAVYGGSDHWDAIAEGGQEKLQRAIQSGGLSVVKSRVIIQVLQQAKARYGVYSLDHLFDASDDDAMREMLSFQGVGPKTASCVLLFCLRRASFAVDTHVYRITGLLGWRPPKASREDTQAHLDALIPAEEKYPLHILLINHGKRCAECRAGGKSLGRCELRKAFRQGRLEGKAGEDIKEEEMEAVKQEEALNEVKEEASSPDS